MAYSGKITLNTVYDIWSYLIRFITEDSTIGGKDWQVIKREVITTGNSVEYKVFKGTLSAVSLDTPIYLPTISTFDYSFGSTATETVGTGDGTTTSFSYTVLNTPIGKWSVEISYTISGTTYIAKDDGTGNISGASVLGTVDYTTGSISLTFSVAPDNATDIIITYLHNNLIEGTDYTIDTLLGNITFLSTGSVASGSNIDYCYIWKPEKMYVYNTGLAGQDNIQFAFLPMIYMDDSKGFILLRGFDEIGLDGTVYGEIGDVGVAFWGNPVDVWVFSNKQRVIYVVKSGSYYSMFYAGYLNRVHLPEEYKEPLILIGSHYNSDEWTTYYADFDNETDYARWIILAYKYYIKTINGAWYMEQMGSVDEYVGHHSPHLPLYGTKIPPITFPPDEVRKFYPILPTTSASRNNYSDFAIAGWYDGIYILFDSNATPESILTDDLGNTFIVFPDVFRTTFLLNYLIKEE